MLVKSYPLEKQTEILKKSDSEISFFIKKISKKELSAFCTKLPLIKGFSHGKDVSQQIDRIIKVMRKDPASPETNKGWESFKALYTLWCNSNVILNGYLNDYNNSSDFTELNKRPVELESPNSELDIKCFRFLASKLDISTDLLIEFYKWGYFLPSNEIEEIIDSRDIIVQTLSHVATSSNKQESFSEEIEFLKRKLGLFENEIVNLRKSIGDLERYSAPKISFSSMEESMKKHEASLLWLKEELRSIRESLKGTSLKTNSIVAELEKKIKQLASNLKDISKLENLVAEVRNTFDGLMETKFNTINLKVLELEERLIKGSAENSLAKDSPFKLETTIVEDRNLKKENYKSFSSIDEIVAGLTDSFCNAGMKIESSMTLSRDVFSGLLARQIVSFKGSMADIVLEATLNAISYRNFLVMHIKPGYLDTVSTLSTALPLIEGNSYIPSIVLKGINNSVFEIYANELKILLNSDDGFFLKPFICLATIHDGPASLNISSALTSVGPIFDTDVLSWENSNDKSEFKGRIHKEAFKSIINAEYDSVPPIPGIENYKRILSLHSNVIWERNLFQAWRWISRVGLPKDLPDAENSLSFGWLIPHSLSQGKHPSRIIESLRQLNLVSVEEKDSRIHRMIEKEARKGGYE